MSKKVRTKEEYFEAENFLGIWTLSLTKILLILIKKSVHGKNSSIARVSKLISKPFISLSPFNDKTCLTDICRDIIKNLWCKKLWWKKKSCYAEVSFFQIFSGQTSS